MMWSCFNYQLMRTFFLSNAIKLLIYSDLLFILWKLLTSISFLSSVKLLDWGEEGHRSEAEIASLRAAFTQEVAVWYKLDHPNVTKVTFLTLTLSFTFSSPIPSSSNGINRAGQCAI